MKKKINNVIDVAGWRMCVGCGACKAVCPKHRISLVNIETDGIRPVADTTACDDCGTCLAICPGIRMTNDTSHPDEIKKLKQGWGTILALYEGHATDHELRYTGSSGGVANALALFCIEKLGMNQVIHTTPDEQFPWLNKTTKSTNRLDLCKTSSSRYSPASPAEGVSLIGSCTGKSVFIGKPCDVAAHYKCAQNIKGVQEKTGCTIGIFCAGTPSTKGTLDLLDKLGVDKEQLEEFRYRGRGWPGMTSYRLKNESSYTEKMTYDESWGFIQKYRPLRCYQCPDGTSEFADISCGDPWHKKATPGEVGISLVLARTSRGKKIIEQAIEAGYVELRSTEPESLIEAQKNLIDKRSWIAGRLITHRLIGIPVPEFKGFNLGKLWMKSSALDKVKSIYGTLRRAFARNYRKPGIKSFVEKK